MNKDVFNAVPMTFHVKEGLDDPEFLRFKAYYLKEEEEIKKQRAIKKSNSRHWIKVKKIHNLLYPKVLRETFGS
jgi:hypothetical protein